MYVDTATGARLVSYHPPPAPPKPRIVYNDVPQGGDDDINRWLLKGSAKRPPPPPDTALCGQCKTETLSRLVRHTPLKGFVCERCIVALGSKCYLSAS